MSRTDIADFLGLTTETVSRTLTQLRQARLIATSERKRINILNQNGLKALVDAATGA